MKKYILLLIIWCGLPATTILAQKTITIKNPTALQRHEVVAVGGVTTEGRAFRVLDAFGIEQPYQLSADGRLLLFVSVRPHGEAAYRLVPGEPMPAKRYVTTKRYPERLDDIVLENDRTGLRFYGPGLQRKGERGFGIDVWLKNTPELIVDSLYRLEFSRHPEIYALRDQGRFREADSLEVLTSFHLNHGLGMDCYNVGPTLGCGTPALISGDELHFPWCYDTYRVVEQGPLRVSVAMDFAPVSGVTEHRLVTLDRGSNFAQMTVWYDGLSQPHDVCAGFVIHAADTTSVVLGRDYLHYADPTGDAARQNCQIYVATLFPEGIDQTKKLMMSQPANGNAGHAVGIRRQLRNGEPFRYFFGSAWSQYDVQSQAEWQLRISQFLEARRRPLVVSVEH